MRFGATLWYQFSTFWFNLVYVQGNKAMDNEIYLKGSNVFNLINFIEFEGIGKFIETLEEKREVSDVKS